MRIDLSDETLHAFKEFFNGYKRKIGELKQDGEMTSKEGKDPLSFSGYRFIARKALDQKDDLGLASFAWCFLLFAWNLIARCVSVSSLMYDHIWWEEDAMVIVFPTQKNDKENKRVSPKHVYANPRSLKSVRFWHLQFIFGALGFDEVTLKRQFWEIQEIMNRDFVLG